MAWVYGYGGNIPLQVRPVTIIADIITDNAFLVFVVFLHRKVPVSLGCDTVYYSRPGVRVGRL